MTTLATAPLAPLLQRLFDEADATTSPVLEDMSPEERGRASCRARRSTSISMAA